MRRSAVVASVLGLASLAACTMSTPFSGPGVHQPVPAEAQVVLSVTHITLRPERERRAQFWQSVARIDAALPAQPGLIGYAKRRELFGDEAWTVTAWRDEDRLRAFVRGATHVDAMAGAVDSIVDARFARVSVPAARLPLPWREVLALLDGNARHYFE